MNTSKYRGENAMDLYQQMDSAMLDGDAERVEQLTREALSTGLQPWDILQHGLVAGIQRMGERYRDGEVFVPEVIMAVQAMQAGFKLLKNKILPKQRPAGYQVVIGSVAGDCHDIGKNLVTMMMQAAGLSVLDLGTDIPPDEFVAAIKKYRPQVLALSAVLTITMPGMEETIQAIREAGLRDRVKIVVGGSPVNNKFAHRIGADAYGEDAIIATQIARQYTG